MTTQLLDYILTGEAARRLGVPDGTRVKYKPYSEEHIKQMFKRHNPEYIYMEDIYSEDMAQRLGGMLVVFPGLKL